MSSVWKVYYITENVLHSRVFVSLSSVCCVEECFNTHRGVCVALQSVDAPRIKDTPLTLPEKSPTVFWNPFSLNFKAFKASPSIYMSTETR